jgi:hypothetical protein
MHGEMITMRAQIASVAELVDAPDSKSGALKSVSVRVRPLAPNPEKGLTAM